MWGRGRRHRTRCQGFGGDCAGRVWSFHSTSPRFPLRCPPILPRIHSRLQSTREYVGFRLCLRPPSALSVHCVQIPMVCMQTATEGWFDRFVRIAGAYFVHRCVACGIGVGCRYRGVSISRQCARINPLRCTLTATEIEIRMPTGSITLLLSCPVSCVWRVC